VTDASEFGAYVLAAAGVVLIALSASKLTRRLRVPAPAVLLLGAAAAGALLPVSEHVSILAVEQIAIVALIVILFDGGMQIGWRSFRSAAGPITALGIAGTFATAAAMAALAHLLFGFPWIQAWLLGAALAPTDPAVMFAVLGNREVGGRAGTILKGEAGANDPAGIALMLGLIAVATEPDASSWTVVAEFGRQMGIGLAIGVVGGWLLIALMRRMSLPRSGLYPLRTLVAAGVIFGLADLARGSGFLAVFVAGLLVGDARAPYKVEIERFHDALASLGEIVVFVALGVTIGLADLGSGDLWLQALALAALLALLVRPLIVGALLAPARLRHGERLFIMWGGLKGAVPILLAAFTLVAGTAGAPQIYGVVFVVVVVSVIAQGATIPAVARRLGVPMRVVEQEPFDLAIRLRRDPAGVQRLTVGRDSRAVGHAIRDLPLGDETWISLIVRAGQPLRARGGTVLEPDDEVLLLSTPEAGPALRRLFAPASDGS
jgi:potassium/hydrogen antiporter